MLEKFIDMLKYGNLSLPRLLLNNYVKLNIKDRELIILIYLINSTTTIYNPNQISKTLNISITEVLTAINSLEELGILQIEIRKVSKISEEHIILDNLYKKLAFLSIDEEEKSSDVYSVFEKEFGRTLSPMEYEIISKWLDNKIDESLIIEALKEAVFNNVSSLNYIDKILIDWKKKGIKSVKDAELERQKFVTKKQAPKQVFEYDWLNDRKNH